MYKKRPSQQAGAVLLIVLVMMILIGMIGISATQSSIFETHISVNHQHKTLAFQAAENGLMKALETENPNDIIPASTTPGASRTINDLILSSNNTGQPDLSTDLHAEFLEKVTADISGYQVDSTILVYRLTATGNVIGTETRAVNRMGIGYITPE